MVNTVLSTAISGLNSATERVNRAAESIAQPQTADQSGGGGSSLPRDIVDLKIGEIEFKANLAVIQTADDLQEELLRTFDKTV